ncbi:MAG TPA: cytochrome P450 [Polyangiaceae bacterium]
MSNVLIQGVGRPEHVLGERRESTLASGLGGDRVLDDPYPIYERLRSEAPVFWDASIGAWLVTRYSDVQQGLKNPRLSAQRIPNEAQVERSGMGKLKLLFRFLEQMMIFRDAPLHTKIRGLVNTVFTPSAIEKERHQLKKSIDEMVLAVRERGQMDLLADIAQALPITVIAGLLGIDAADRRRFKAWSDDITAFLGGVKVTAEITRAAEQSARELTAYLSWKVKQARESGADTIIGRLTSVAADGHRLTDDEVVATCANLLIAGHETTTNLVGNGVLALCDNPEQQARLRNHPGSTRTAIEEVLRFDSPIQMLARIATSDHELHGQSIQAGNVLRFVVGSANRDAQHFDRPNVFDIERSDLAHLSFGVGPHFCIGAALARLEAELLIDGLLSGLGPLARSEHPIEWHQNLFLRGVKALHITWTA